MTKPLVSVVIPSFNHSAFIGQAIASVIEQTYRPLELIIIDDGSSDDSEGAIRRAMFKNQNHPRGISIVYINQENQGAHAAINRGLSLARGEWLTILNSDDYYYPHRIERLIGASIRRQTLLSCSRVKHVDELGRPSPTRDPMVEWYRRVIRREFPTVGFHLLFSNIVVTTGNLFFHRTLLTRLAGFRSYKLMHDYDFVLRSLTWTEPTWLQETLMAYRAHGKNTVLSLQNEHEYEAPGVATDFVAQTILYPIPPNSSAPWAPKYKNQFMKFIQDCEGAWMRDWIGHENVPEKLGHLLEY